MRDVEVRQRRVFGVHQVLPGGDAAAAAAAEHDGQVVRIVAVAVADAAAEQDHGIVEHDAVAFLHVAQLAQQVGVLLDVPAVDELILAHLVGVLLVVRDVVVRAAHASRKEKFWLLTALPNMNVRDARGVGLEGQRDHVEHPANVLGVVFRDLPGGCAPRSSGARGFHLAALGFAGALHPLFERAHDREILVQALAVGAPSWLRSSLGVGRDAVQQQVVLRRLVVAGRRPRGTGVRRRGGD